MGSRSSWGRTGTSLGTIPLLQTHNGHEHMTIAPSLLQAIGRTPLVRLRAVVPPGAADVLVKLEFYNPTGSYKDRMALAMIEGAEQRGVLKPGMRVIEFTGGSTGS